MREFTSKKAAEGNEATVTLAPVSFVLDGVKFDAEATVSILDLGWLYQFEEVDANSIEGMRAVTRFLQLVLGPEVFAKLSTHLRRHRTDGDTLIGIVQHIVESVTERPTVAPSSSGPSTAPTAPSSTEPSSPPATELPRRTISLATGSVSEAS